MNLRIKPIALSYGYLNDDKDLVFNVLGSDIIISSYVEEFQRTVQLCNGLRTIGEIVESLPELEDGLVNNIISFLLKKEVLIDSTKQFQTFHEVSSNPSIFSIGLNSEEVADLRRKPRIQIRRGEVKNLPTPKQTKHLQSAHLRVSTRVFSDKPMPFEQLSDFLQNLYGDGDYWLTPSAGGLYPLDIYFVNFQDNGLEEGIYQFIPERSEVIRVSDSAHLDSFCFAMNTSELLNGKNQLIVLSVNLGRLSSKYSNRGYRYGLLEAGHVAQNAYMYAATNGIGILEYGGYQDEELCKLFRLNPEKQPIAITLIVGNKVMGDSSRPKLSLSHLSEKLEMGMKKLGVVQEDLVLRTYSQGGKVVPRVFAFGLYGLKDGNKPLSRSNASYSCASGHCLHEARVKVLAEAFERHASNQVEWDEVSAADHLAERYLTPPLLSRDVQGGSGRNLFQDSEVIQWKRGYRFSTGETILIPVEMVYYPVKAGIIGREPFYRTSSNGVAAHTEREEAILSGVLELVERDALMVHWFSKKPVRSISHKLIPPSISGRHSMFTKSGVEIKFLDISLDTVHVILCLFRSDDGRPYLASGAAAALSLEGAMIKAYNEAEFMFLSWRNMRYGPIDPKDVASVKDHGRVYIDPSYHEELQWLLGAEERVGESRADLTPEQLLQDVDPYVVEIAKPSDEVPLWVVRVISESLLPIHFGLGNEHDPGKRLKELGLRNQRSFPSFPHFFS